MTTSDNEPAASSSTAPTTSEKDDKEVARDVLDAEKEPKASPSSSEGSPEVDGSESDQPPTTEDPSSSASVPSPAFQQGTWQAIWSPGHNAYYFYNAATQETTWENPLQPSSTSEESTTATTETPVASSSTATSAQLSRVEQLQAAAVAQGIDPSLAYLDPSLVAAPAVEGYTAKFNARTGTFTRPDGRDPTHLSEYERAKRMSEFYFDVNKWQEDVAERKLEEEADGKKRKRPSKKDLVCPLFSFAGINTFLIHQNLRKGTRSRRKRRNWLRRLGCVHERECDLECA